MSVMLRAGQSADAPAIHQLVTSNLEVGHLLPRTLEEIQDHIGRFIVAQAAGRVVGCAELARLSPSVAEIRSLVVEELLRGQQIGTKLVTELAARATAAGYATICAFTHDPAPFVRLGFTIVPHIWLPEKIAHDCTSCVFFRRCGQYAVRLPLREGIGAVPERTAVMAHGRGVAPRRPNIERLHLTPCHQEPDQPDPKEDAEPAEVLHA